MAFHYGTIDTITRTNCCGPDRCHYTRNIAVSVISDMPVYIMCDNTVLLHPQDKSLKAELPIDPTVPTGQQETSRYLQRYAALDYPCARRATQWHHTLVVHAPAVVNVACKTCKSGFVWHVCHCVSRIHWVDTCHSLCLQTHSGISVKSAVFLDFTSGMKLADSVSTLRISRRVPSTASRSTRLWSSNR